MSATHPLRIIFAGTPDFAAASLRALSESAHQVVAVYTQPDRPAGRGRKLTASPVKELALQCNFPLRQPASLKNEAEQQELKQFDADLMVVAAYGLILPQAVLSIPRLGCINVHASLLPRWRGAAPIQHAILAGDEETGVTIMQMDAGLDTGNMLHRLSCPILATDTGSSLHDKLAGLGAQALIETLENLEEFQAAQQVQDDRQANYAHKLDKQQAQLNWSEAADQLERRIRAFNAWPVAYSQLEGQRVRIWQAKALSKPAQQPPGTITSCSSGALCVACGEGLLKLEVIQLAGAKALPVSEVLKARGDWFAAGKSFDFRQ